MHNSIVFCSWTLQIVLEWLHQGCDCDLSADFLNFGAGDFPYKIPLKSASKSCFFCFGPEISGFGAAISHAVARSSIVFCNSIFEYRIVMAASRLLSAAAACAILLAFAAGHRKSYWSDCIKAAMAICQQIFKNYIVLERAACKLWSTK
jgi:hypothetical protein